MPCALLGAVFLLVPDLRALLGESLAGLLASPVRYGLWGAAVFTLLLGYARFLDGRLDRAAVGWILYLLAVSTWEEWLFRLAIPYFGHAQGLELGTAVLLSNLGFGALHYFTLRWKWPWCVAAFLGGMALSRQMNEHFDLALVIAIHWVATFVNTPRPPGRLRVTHRT